MDFNNYSAKGNKVLDQVAEQLGFPENRDLAGRILRAVLHAWRDRLTIEASFKFMAQLPFVLKALYVEGWKFHNKPERIKHVKDFVRKVIHEDFPVGHHDFQTAKDGENAVMAVTNVIKNHVSEGEIKDVIASIPPELRTLWGEGHEVNLA